MLYTNLYSNYVFIPKLLPVYEFQTKQPEKSTASKPPKTSFKKIRKPKETKEINPDKPSERHVKLVSTKTQISESNLTAETGDEPKLEGSLDLTTAEEFKAEQQQVQLGPKVCWACKMNKETTNAGENRACTAAKKIAGIAPLPR